MAASPGKLLQGKLVLISGASRGIGAAVAERCAREGAALILAARSADKLREVADHCRAAGAASCEAEQCDVASPASVQVLAARVKERHSGGLDVLCNVAGIASDTQDILTGDPDEWDAMFATNTLAPMRLTREFAPGMAAKGGGLIVTVGSLAGTAPMPGAAPYAASKWGIRGWVLSSYEELRRHNIKTVVIEPGFVATDMVLPKGNLVADRCIQPADIAEAAMLPLRMSANAVPVEWCSAHMARQHASHATALLLPLLLVTAGWKPVQGGFCDIIPSCPALSSADVYREPPPEASPSPDRLSALRQQALQELGSARSGLNCTAAVERSVRLVCQHTEEPASWAIFFFANCPTGLITIEAYFIDAPPGGPVESWEHVGELYC